MKTAIMVAVIGAVASVGAAFIMATMTAEKTAIETADRTTQEIRQEVGAVKQVAEKATKETQAVERRLTREIFKRIEKLDVVTAGAVKKDGTVIRHVGFPFTVIRRKSGQYRVNFRDPFKEIPVVIATSDGGDRGAFAEITSVDSTGFTVEGRTYSAHGLAEIGFQFVAVHATGR